MIVGQVPEWISNPIDEVMSSEKIDWVYNPRLTGDGPGIRNFDNKEDTFQFTYTVFDNTGYKTNLTDYILGDLWDHIMKNQEDIFNNFKEVLRVKGNLLTRSNSSDAHIAHVDTDLKHLVILYYVNDSDGDTTVYNETFGDDFDKLTVKQTVSPKKGRYIIFDGAHFHASASPSKHDVRIVLNFNALINTI